jgi:ring-1,2-phenylacetyl-CoA epoxidase subunit PaaD
MVTATASAHALAEARAVVESVLDPELGDITIGDLGLVRDVTCEDGRIVVEVTPTYGACPAFETICHDIEAALAAHGRQDSTVVRRPHPPWTSDWMTERGRQLLQAGGISPPSERAAPGPVFVPLLSTRTDDVLLDVDAPCPICASTETETVSWFGSSACKSLHRCRSCHETYEAFKTVASTSPVRKTS